MRSNNTGCPLGRLKLYLGPFQLFLFANVLFFAMQSLTNTNIFSSTLDSHLHNQDWHAFAQHLVSQRLQTLQTTLELYAPIFDRAIVLHAKSGIILMVLPFAILLPVLFYRNRQPFVAYAVFSLHFYAFVLLLFCQIVPPQQVIIEVPAPLIRFSGRNAAVPVEASTVREALGAPPEAGSRCTSSG